MSTIIEMTVEGTACRFSREALVLAVEARDPAAVVTVDPTSGRVCADTELDLGSLLLAIETSGCRPFILA
ncbi:hypothetical protein EJV46_06695 [Roseococcus sp. SYP-B2431]|uniref:hypothetical protein n=1 Tax=Roseococcus sp. SYP-B2431 TaxID=2496640 RepID=UPI0010394332|nr:hypothetical protein [Roseococcus sp. SYP-B2431]TCI00316.1 hypothetical protein EJV46_06695 [Roseococcus sp. SYP-B2431]